MTTSQQLKDYQAVYSKRMGVINAAFGTDEIPADGEQAALSGESASQARQLFKADIGALFDKDYADAGLKPLSVAHLQKCQAIYDAHTAAINNAFVAFGADQISSQKQAYSSLQKALAAVIGS